MSTKPIDDLPQAIESRNLRCIGHTDLGGHGDCMQVSLKDNVAYVAHMGASRVGTSVVDVSDPRRPKLIDQLYTPPGMHSHKVQVVDDIMIVNYEWNFRVEPEAPEAERGLKVFDVSHPSSPREIGFLPMTGLGVHRMCFQEGTLAYVSGTEEGWTDNIFMVIDLAEPSNPREIGRWWLPGMYEGGGEQFLWSEDSRIRLHHPLVRGDRAYCPWWDAGLVILDIAAPSDPKLVSETFFDGSAGTTHTALPVPGRDLLVVAEESTAPRCQEEQRHVRVIDISDERTPAQLSTFPVPEGDYCDRGGRFGPHNLHEMQPGRFISSDTIHVAYFNAGLRIVDISDARAPKEVAWFVPESPPGQDAIQFNDVMVDEDELVYVTDRVNGGLYILERTD